MSFSVPQVVHQHVISAQAAQERVISQEAICPFTIAQLVDEVAQGNNPSVVDFRSSIGHEEHQIPDIPDWAMRDVSDWLVDGKALDITKENSIHYLNAAKYFDLMGNSANSTYPLRMECLRKNPEKLTTVEAFSYRLNPEFFNRYSEDGTYLLAKNLAIMAAAETQIAFIPEWQETQKSIAKEVIGTICSFSDQLSYQEPHFILFTGTFGSGKSYQTKNHSLMKKLAVDPESPFNGVLSSDAVKKVYMKKHPGLTNNQVHQDGCALRIQMMHALLRHRPNLTIVQEAVLSTPSNADETLSPILASNRKVKIVFTDTNFENAVLSILTRAPGEAVPPFGAIVSSESNVRKTRLSLHERIAKEPLVVEYELLYRDQNSLTVVARKDNGQVTVVPGFEEYYKSLQAPTDPAIVEAVRTRLVSEKDVALYGDQLVKFIGMTVEDAVLKLSRM